MKVLHYAAWPFVLWVVLLAISASAQINEGTLVGTVRDASGALIANAAVAATNVDTNVAASTVTNSVGEYILRNVLPGRYTVACTLTGFKREVFTDLTLRAGTTSRVDFTLSPGEVQQEVTVTSEAPLLQTENASVGGSIANQSFVELPLKGRLAIDLALLQAGVFLPAAGTGGTWSTDFGGEFGQTVVISGVRDHYSNYLLDGTTIYQSFSGYIGYSPSIEAIQEVRVDTSNNNARQGRVAGGTISFTTRAGTNMLHGSFYEFLRHDKLDALAWGSPPPKPAYRYNQFGFRLDGPWYIPKLYNGKNRTFFMINYEGLKVRRHGAGGAIVPTSLEKAGVFTGGAPVTDPTTGAPFPNNVIPAARIHPISSGIVKYYPDPNTANNPRFNYVSSGSDTTDVDQINLRADHHFSPEDNVFYSFAHQTSTQVPRQVLAGLGFNGDYPFSKHTISYNHMFGPAILNNARFGLYDRNNTLLNFRAFEEDVWTIVGLNKVAPRITIPPEDWGIPSISIFGYNQIADQRGSQHDQIQLDLYDDFTWNRGNHVLQFGASVLYEKQNVNLPLLNLPSMSFNGSYTGNSMADFVLGYLDSSSVTQGAFDPRCRQWHYGFYFQDDWHASSRLTLNLGLRYEYNSPPTETRDKLASWDPARNRLVYPGEVSKGVLAPYRKDWSPRVGLAYRIQDKTVIRAAYGVYWNTEFSSQTESELNPPFLVTENFFGNPRTPNLTLNDPFPLGSGQQPIPSPAVRNTYMKDAYIQQWNFTVERNLPLNSTLSVGYVGNKGTRLPWYGYQPNWSPPGPGDIQAKRPFPQYGAFWYVDGIGASTYNALQARWERRFADGLLLLANYTWSKSINVGEEALYFAGNGQAGTQDNNCLRCEKGLALYDVPHRFVLSYVWQIPSGGLSGLARTLAGGWEISGSTAFQNGNPYTITAPLARPNGDASVRPLVVGDWRVPEKTWERQFNPAAFATPPDFTLGNLGQRTHRAGGLNQFDLGLLKNFIFAETHRVQFRTEFFNAFNHPTFGIPDRAVGSPRFGLVTSSTQKARSIQFGLKYMF